MKLFDIIREMDGEADGMANAARAKFDFIIQTPDAQAAVDALSNIDNYGSYAQGMRDPEAIKKIFGPSNPNEKLAAALKQWRASDKDGKESKILDISKRYPEAFNKAKEEWESAGGEGDFVEHLITTNLQLPKTLLGPKGTHYFPNKTPDNLKKYSGKMEEGVHYLVDGDEITFPLKNSPYATKAYLEKVVKTIMDNAGVKYQILRIEDTDSPEAAKVQRSSKSDAPPLSTTLPDRADASALRKTIQNKFTIPSAKYEIVPTEGGEVKLIVTGLTPSQRASIQAITTDYARNLMENKLRMQKLAGIITESELKHHKAQLWYEGYANNLKVLLNNLKSTIENENKND
jgi:hypothetical protein